MAYSSLYEGVSGLNSQMKKMEVVGNNLANLNTAGFKKERVTFSDLFYNTISQASKSQGNIGGINSKQIGTGVDVASIDTIFTQGSKTSTGRELDFMVHGTDFFVVKSAVTDDLFLTRNGAFELDGEMQLLDSVGNAVIGRNVDPNTQVAGAAEAITIDDSAIDANATTAVTISDNIDLSSPEKFVESNSRMWELFSGGENFGEFGISDTSVQGSRTTYGSGYYGDTVRYTLDNTTLLTSADANSTLRYLANG